MAHQNLAFQLPAPEQVSPEAVLDMLDTLLTLNGSVRLKLRLAHHVLAQYFADKPIDPRSAMLPGEPLGEPGA
jgi:hypothetical protein